MKFSEVIELTENTHVDKYIISWEAATWKTKTEMGG
jgi:hypothetical protein